MSDNWNPGREPAEGEQPEGPPDRPAEGGQSPRWWTESVSPQREYLPEPDQRPARPHNNWFGDGWSDRHQEDGAPSESSYLWGSQQGTPPHHSAPQPPPPQQGPPQQHNWGGGGQHAAPGGQLGPMGQPVQQEPTWQYPPIPIPQPPGGGRRRKKKTSRGLLIGLVVLAVLVVGSGVTLAVRNTGDDNPKAAETPSASPSETTSETPSETPSATPSATPTPTPTKPPKPRVSPADVTVTRNKLYKAGAFPGAKCVEPPFAPTNIAGARNYYNRLLPCVNHSWWLALRRAGLPYRAPKINVYAGTVASPCGAQRSVRAAYCGVNQTIYLPFSADNRLYKQAPMYARAVMLNNFAHEYGHHVQNLAGILTASIQRQQGKTPAQKLEESRRRELQATCLGAVYLGASSAGIPLRGPLLTSYKYLITHTGDQYSKPVVRDHGSRGNNYFWSIMGFNRKTPAFCNTFVAAAKRVG